MHREEFLTELSALTGDVYLWGLGARGEAIQKFCYDEKIHLAGVCDLRNDKIGQATKYGYSILSTQKVLETSDVILASNAIIFDDLIEKGYKGTVLNLQKYMSLGVFGKKI